MLSARRIRSTAFALQKGGYATASVDAALERLEDAFAAREREAALAAADGERAWYERVKSEAQEILDRVAGPAGGKFDRVSGFTSATTARASTPCASASSTTSRTPGAADHAVRTVTFPSAGATAKPSRRGARRRDRRDARRPVSPSRVSRLRRHLVLVSRTTDAQCLRPAASSATASAAPCSVRSSLTLLARALSAARDGMAIAPLSRAGPPTIPQAAGEPVLRSTASPPARPGRPLGGRGAARAGRVRRPRPSALYWWGPDPGRPRTSPTDAGSRLGVRRRVGPPVRAVGRESGWNVYAHNAPAAPTASRSPRREDGGDGRRLGDQPGDPDRVAAYIAGRYGSPAAHGSRPRLAAGIDAAVEPAAPWCRVHAVELDLSGCAWLAYRDATRRRVDRAADERRERGQGLPCPGCGRRSSRGPPTSRCGARTGAGDAVDRGQRTGTPCWAVRR